MYSSTIQTTIMYGSHIGNGSTRDRALTDRATRRDAIPHTRATRRTRTRDTDRERRRENVRTHRALEPRTRARERAVNERRRLERARVGTTRRILPARRAGADARETRERWRIIPRASVGRDELGAQRVGAEGGEQVSTGAKDREWEFWRHLPRCVRGWCARGHRGERECERRTSWRRCERACSTRLSRASRERRDD